LTCDVEKTILARLLVEAEVLALRPDHDDLRRERALDEEGPHRPARLRRRHRLARPELVEKPALSSYVSLMCGNDKAGQAGL